MSHETKSISILASLMSIRMLGLFMILPVFAAYASHLSGATSTLIGITLGIYGLTQALFQLPFGILSDHFGRKPIIFAGLLLLLAGSVIAALSHSIYLLLIGRALQGSGAIGSTVLAFVADLTSNESRHKAMAIMGLSIGLAFTAAMLLGPIISASFQLAGIFWVTAALACLGMLLLARLPHAPNLAAFENGLLIKRIFSIFKNQSLMRLNISIFLLHTILTATFIAIPIIFFHTLKISRWEQVELYFVVLLTSFAMALPFIIFAERKQKTKLIMLGAITIMGVIELLFSITHHHVSLIACFLILFFTAFTVLEAILPSQVSKTAPSQYKGTAMGIYSSFQFLGIFAGGSIGGLILSRIHITGLFFSCMIVAFLWLLLVVNPLNKTNCAD